MTYVRELLQAATTISNTEIREEDMSYLLAYRSEFETAFQKLHALLGPSSRSFPVSVASPTNEIPVLPGSPSSQATEQRLCVSEPLPRGTPERTPPILASHDKAVDPEVKLMEAVPGSVRDVLRLLNKRKESISAFTFRPETYPDIYSGHKDEDFRVTLINFVSQKRTESEYYLAGRAALSLADDFLLWQGEIGIPRRLDVLSKNVNDKTGACYRAYADICTFFKDKERAALYMEFGIRLLFFELLCLVRYRGPITCPDSPSTHEPTDPGAASRRKLAVVYPLFFVSRAFYRCKYSEIPALASAFLSSQHWRELAEAKEDWQGLDCPLFTGADPHIEHVIPEQNGKRILTDQSSKEQPKRQRLEQSSDDPPIRTGRPISDSPAETERLEASTERNRASTVDTLASSQSNISVPSSRLSQSSDTTPAAEDLNSDPYSAPSLHEQFLEPELASDRDQMGERGRIARADDDGEAGRHPSKRRRISKSSLPNDSAQSETPTVTDTTPLSSPECPPRIFSATVPGESLAQDVTPDEPQINNFDVDWENFDWEKLVQSSENPDYGWDQFAQDL